VTAALLRWDSSGHGGLHPRRGPGRRFDSSRRDRPAQSGAFRTTPLLTCTVATLRRTALMRSWCATTSTEAPASLVPAGLEAADDAYIERMAGVTERDPTPAP
jgi:hypothetical protein